MDEDEKRLLELINILRDNIVANLYDKETKEDIYDSLKEFVIGSTEFDKQEMKRLFNLLVNGWCLDEILNKKDIPMRE